MAWFALLAGALGFGLVYLSGASFRLSTRSICPWPRWPAWTR